MPDTAANREQPWLDTSLGALQRARHLVAALSVEEKVGLLSASYAGLSEGTRPERALGSAAFTAGVTRLGIPDIQESDAGLGVANPGGVREGDDATALPSSLAWGASFAEDIAYRAGALVGEEGWVKGFAIQLAGGSNIIRDPRCGRNFEYVAEDPLLTGVISGAAIAGIQSRRIVSTIKHFAVNAQETGRVMMSSDLSEAALRESDLLGLEIAIDRGKPGAVMTAYNQVNGDYCSENGFLLTTVLKGDWRYPGFVMSDWGGTHSTVQAALAGLDRQSAPELDAEPYFAQPLLSAVREGHVSTERVDDMATRILLSLITAGILDHPPTVSYPDVAAHQSVAREVASGVRSCWRTMASCRCPHRDGSRSSVRMRAARCPGPTDPSGRDVGEADDCGAGNRKSGADAVAR